MASSRKIDDFSSYQDFILFLTTSLQQLHGAHRRMSPRAAGVVIHAVIQAASIYVHDHAAAAAARASDRCDACTAGHGGPAGAAAAACMALDGCPSVDFCNRRARFTQAARKCGP
jgi:hypothetical protein